MKKLYRSKTNKIIAGIIGGLGEYFNVDPTIFRLVFIVFMFATGVLPAVLAYLVCMLIVPKAPAIGDVIHAKAHEVKKEEPKTEEKKEDTVSS